ncbi:hypothetical protein D1819_09010 [Pseudoalteromonas tunicata]|uniref:4'-phosphopantetheinyl transferase domain-containing protein n=1 Tax=Pseudoalteromonas tunicata D2 TaxID=87626 RepID=A4C5U8_9GAMM|nr:hypothetical protein D1819_09010 [Pseudoalteromonas tunicata]EAR29352.1 hypothetical protein PTD2_11069 [Pseudoalteromonas tunicata D2]
MVSENLLTRFNIAPNVSAAVIHLDCLGQYLQQAEARKTLLGALHKTELANWLTMPYQRQAISWLGARLAAKWLLQPLFPSRSLCQITVEKDHNGAPFCRLSGKALGLSHTGKLAIAVVGEGVFGVDIEAHLRILALPKPWLNEQELQAGANMTLTQLWCFKEALYKAVGGGLFIDFCQAVEIITWHKDKVTIATNLPNIPLQWRVFSHLYQDHNILYVEPNYA